jgi:hypothetical protein
MVMVKKSLDDLERINLLNKHPNLKPFFDRLLYVAEAGEGLSGSADEIEIMVRNEVNNFGRQTINDWAINYEVQKAAIAANSSDLKKHGKKNSIGTQRSE